VPSVPSSSSPVLVLATLNPHKGRELVALLGAVPFQIKLLSEFPDARLPEETGQTYAENALVKARTAAVKPTLFFQTSLTLISLATASTVTTC